MHANVVTCSDPRMKQLYTRVYTQWYCSNWDSQYHMITYDNSLLLCVLIVQCCVKMAAQLDVLFALDAVLYHHYSSVTFVFLGFNFSFM